VRRKQERRQGFGSVAFFVAVMSYGLCVMHYVIRTTHTLYPVSTNDSGESGSVGVLAVGRWIGSAGLA
jgi:hypothetical protein